jgi:hypothetical protein
MSVPRSRFGLVCCEIVHADLASVRPKKGIFNCVSPGPRPVTHNGQSGCFSFFTTWPVSGVSCRQHLLLGLLTGRVILPNAAQPASFRRDWAAAH